MQPQGGPRQPGEMRASSLVAPSQETDTRQKNAYKSGATTALVVVAN